MLILNLGYGMSGSRRTSAYQASQVSCITSLFLNILWVAAAVEELSQI